MALLVLVASCADSSGPCGEYYDNSKRCWVEETRKRIADGHGDRSDLEALPSRGAYIAECRSSMRNHKDEILARVECSKEDTCDDKKACEDKVEEAEQVKQQIEDVERYVAKASWEDAFRECRYLRDEPAPELLAACDRVFTEGMPALTKGGKGEDVRSACSYSDDLKRKAPAFAKACVDVMSAEYEVKKAAAVAARDAASDDYMLCSELRTLAAAVDEQAKKDAEALCSEMTISSSAKQALTEAQLYIDSNQSQVSYYCTSALDSLTLLPEPKSAWAKQTTDKLIKTCFLDAGKVIAAIELSSEYPYCSYSLTQVRDAITKYGLAGKDPEFDAAIAKTDKICSSY